MDTMFTDRERHEYEPPPCPVCGAPMATSWADCITHDQDPDDPDAPRWVPGLAECAEHGRPT